MEDRVYMSFAFSKLFRSRRNVAIHAVEGNYSVQTLKYGSSYRYFMGRVRNTERVTLEQAIAINRPSLQNKYGYFTGYEAGEYRFGIQDNSQVVTAPEEFYDAMGRPDYNEEIRGTEVIKYFSERACEYKTEQTTEG